MRTLEAGNWHVFSCKNKCWFKPGNLLTFLFKEMMQFSLCKNEDSSKIINATKGVFHNTFNRKNLKPGFALQLKWKLENIFKL